MTPSLKRNIENIITTALGTFLAGLAGAGSVELTYANGLEGFFGAPKWVSAKNGEIPDGAIISGIDRSGRTLYTCRVEDEQGGVHPGKIAKIISQNDKGEIIAGYDHCAYAFGEAGSEFKRSRTYEVLTQ